MSGVWYKARKKASGQRGHAEVKAFLAGKTHADLVDYGGFTLTTMCAKAGIAETGTKSDKAARMLVWYKAH